MVANAQPHGSGETVRAVQVRALACLNEALELLDRSRAAPQVRARLHECIEALNAKLNEFE